MTAYSKPVPTRTDHNAPYWDGLKAHEVRLCFCQSCGRASMEDFRWCPSCAGTRFEWRPVSGRGIIWSWTIFHQLYFEGFRDELPYNVCVVELQEGLRLYSNLVGTRRDEISIGQAVTAVFDDVTPDLTLLKFRLAE